MSNEWSQLVLKYLSRRLPLTGEELLEEAIQVAPNKIKEYLKTYQKRHLHDIKDIYQPPKWLREFCVTATSLHTELATEDTIHAQVIKLVEADLLSPLPWAYHRFESGQRVDALQAGLDQCYAALRIAKDLNDQPCQAFYLNLIGQILYARRELKKAPPVLKDAESIYETLVRDDFEFQTYLAIVKTNLARVFRERYRYSQARDFCEQAIELYAPWGESLDDDLAHAHTCRTLASVLREIGSLRRAEVACREALAVFQHHLNRRITHEYRISRDDYKAYKALTSTTLASICQRDNRPEEARSWCRTAREIYKKLPVDKADFYLPNQSFLSFVNGDVYQSLGDLHPQSRTRYYNFAIAHYEDAQDLYQRLNQEYRHMNLDLTFGDRFERYAARTQQRLAVVQCKLGRYSEADDNFAQSQHYFEEKHYHFDSAFALADWARMEEARTSREDPRHHDVAYQRYVNSVQQCRLGIQRLSRRTRTDDRHRDDEYHPLFKGKIEQAYYWLIEHFNEWERLHSEPSDAAVTLIGYLEDIRYFEVLSESGEVLRPSHKDWEPEIRDFLEKRGSLYELFNTRKCKMLWIQATPNLVVFVTLDAQNAKNPISIASTDIHFLEENAILLAKIKDVFEYPSVRGWSVEKFGVIEMAAKLYHWLPTQVAELLFATPSTQYVFVSPCGQTIDVPFELIKKEAVPVAADYQGLQVVTPRIQGLQELMDVHQRNPPPMGKRTALLVADPDHSGSTRLPQSADLIFQIGEIFKSEKGARLVPTDKVLCGSDATRDAVLAGLKQKHLCLWVYVGHGVQDKDLTQDNYLELSGEGQLTIEDLQSLNRLPHTAIYLDCCNVGRCFPQPGGRLRGFPSILLQKGASCVMSSHLPIWDDMSRDFCQTIAQLAFFPTPEVKDLGQAVLWSRRHTAQKYPDDPLSWALLTPWGNPWAQLMTPSQEADQMDL